MPGATLRSLSVGWGFACGRVRALCAAAAAGGGGLTRLELRVGAAVNDAGLAAAAGCCPHLRELRLELCGVSGAGVGAALAACAQLHVLHVVGCAGPWGREELLRPLGWLPPRQEQREQGQREQGQREQGQGHREGRQRGPGAAGLPEGGEGAGGSAGGGGSGGGGGGGGGVVIRWAMSDLRLEGGPMQMYDEDLLSLLYGRPMYGGGEGVYAAGVRGSCATPASSGGSSVGGSDAPSETYGGRPGGAAPEGPGDPGLSDPGPASLSPAAPVSPAGAPSPGPGLRCLHTLALVGFPWLSQRLLLHLRDHCTEVRHVRLEGCGHRCCPAPPAGASAAAAAAAAAPFEAGALLEWLGRCRLLENLRLRHCCRLGEDAVARLSAACPSLEQLMLDGCDLPPCGFASAPSSYGALSYVMVARCRADTARLLGDAVRQLGGGTGGDARPSPEVAEVEDGPGRSTTAVVEAGGAECGTVDGSGLHRCGVAWWLPCEKDVKVIRFCDGALAKLPMYEL
ncbi:hypothetical protein TSOC_004227 [Tetrabaena socialis]|uniref:Uncharacterized protein n=1 Tax=Tetrabaena socialis TaxID=47790 RepID=A0A2J8A9E8_9CHLO|nr:hypothetical protein TSOC_004227 [Tetrabaena socialis]|eukprot:PNH09158.1 hypothetical protein TSOC_004227 [Tetrabaena socialis]